MNCRRLVSSNMAATRELGFAVALEKNLFADLSWLFLKSDTSSRKVSKSMSFNAKETSSAEASRIVFLRIRASENEHKIESREIVA